jgi:CubicO group peptidase (beta-lactamase class C family)
MKPSLTLLVLTMSLLPPASPGASRDEARPGLPRATPESQGVSSAGILDFIEAADRDLGGLHSVMILRHGRVITEGWWAPYDAASRHELYSLSKSFTSAAVGLAIGEGHLSLDDEVTKFFPGDVPADASANLKAMRVRDLLTMSTGHQDETSSSPDRLSPASFLAHPVRHKPGTHFKYNTPATFMLAAIVEKQTGQHLIDYLRPRLFEPLGIENPTWDTNKDGVALGGYGLRVRTEDIARFGQLHLQQGRWKSRVLLDPAWIAQATGRQVSNGSNPKSDWEQGYGFQFWRCRHGAYRGDGAFGQYCVVLPDQDAVIAITSGLKDMQAVLNSLWDRVLPAIKDRRLPADRAAWQRLSAKLASLSLPTVEGSRITPTLTRIGGRPFAFDANEQKLESLSIEAGTDSDAVVLSLTQAGVSTRIPCGFRSWRQARGPFGPLRDEALAACAGWVSEDALTVRVCARETPYVADIRLRWAGDQVTYEFETNVGFGGTRRPALTGRAR